MLSDTTPQMVALVLDLRRKQTPGQRMSNSLEMTELVRSLEIGLLRRQHPDASADTVRYLLAVKRYGRELAGKAFDIQAKTA